MADMSKAEKLAAARKKLKEYQQKPKDSNKTIAHLKTTSQNDVPETRNGKETFFQSSFNKAEPPPHTLQQSYHRPDEVTETYIATPQLPQHYYNNNNNNNNNINTHYPAYNSSESIVKNHSTNEDSNSVNGTSFAHTPTESLQTPAQPVCSDFFDNLPTQNTDWLSNQSTFATSFTYAPEQNATLSSNFAAPIDLIENAEAISSEYSSDINLSSSIEQFEYLNQESIVAPSENVSADVNLLSTVPDTLLLKTLMPEPSQSIDNSETKENSDDHQKLVTDHNDSDRLCSLPELSIPEINPFVREHQYAMGFMVPEKQTDKSGELNSEINSSLVQTWSTEQPNLLAPASIPPPNSKTDDLHREETTTDEKESLPTKLENATLVTQQAPVSPRSTAENIRQLSMHMNGLIRESSHSPINAERNELEFRNQELAALLDLERQRSEQLQQHLQEYESRLTQTLAETEAARAAGEVEGRREVAALQEQLQLHAQTLGILVAEKTELQAALTQFQAAAKQKVSDAEELKSRLNASRHRVGDLEKELNTLRTSTEQNETVRQTLAIEFEQLKREQALVTLRLQETLEEREEINHRLVTKATECSTIGQELLETKTQLSLAQLRVDQLSSHTSPDDTSHLETLYQDKINLEHKVTELELKLSSVEATEEEKYKQYQLYVTSMDEQLHGLTECNERLAAENRQLMQREDSLVLHVTGLERRLQDAMRPQHVVPAQAEPSAELEGILQKLKEEKKKLEEAVETKTEANKVLEATLREREARIEEVESFLDRLQGDQPDQARLLAAMESDKVAASRAVSQNQFLKQELEEIQNKNIQLSDGLFDITDKLQHERHVSRELTQRVAEQETWINQLNEELSARPKQSQPADGGHHYEDHGQIADILHRELAQTKDRVEALTQQNMELRGLLAQGPARPADGEDDRDERIRLLTAERDSLLGMEEGAESPVSRYAMERLQERFTSTMREVAELSDEKQRLEHLVLQLQGETETIGEYIALYQKQRSLLRERADEKDTQLKCLAQDREEMRGKLTQLNELIRKLVAERGAASVDSVLGDLANIAGEQPAEVPVAPDQVEVATAATETLAPKDDTANEIMALLTEIGSSNLIDPQQMIEHFHPCAWCSGRLITV